MIEGRGVSNSHELYAVLRDAILGGKYKRGGRIPAIRELASEYGLNKGTVNTVVSMLVNEGLLYISPGKGTFVREREWASAQPIGVVLLDFSGPAELDMRIIGDLQRNLSPGFFLLPIGSAKCWSEFNDKLELLLSMGAVGLAAIPPQPSPDSADELRRAAALMARAPAVLINRPVPGCEVDMVTMDLNQGVLRAFDYFASQGKRRVAIILHNTEYFIDAELAAFAEASERGFSRDERLLIPYTDDFGALQASIRALLPELDALVGPDKLIQPMQEFFANCGKRIPRELSIVGINDTLLTRMFHPQMSALAYPSESICRDAMRLLSARIAGEAIGKPTVRKYIPELIVRGT